MNPVNREIEAKIQLPDPSVIQKRLPTLIAVLVSDHLEINTYFDDGNETLKRSDQGLRLRIARAADGTATVAITHKGPRDFSMLKSRTEVEIQIDDERAGWDLLSALGYVPVLQFEKKRQRWSLDGCHVDLDRMPYLGAYLEIEGPAEETVLSVRQKLGLSAAPLIHTSYPGLLQDYLRTHSIDRHRITFAEAGASSEI